MSEQYKTISDHPNYEVSNFGNVRNKKTGTVRKLTDRKGYRKVRLNNKDESVHRLVAEAFYSGDHKGLQVNHIDGNKSNNSIDNLEWVSPSENVKHAFSTGLKNPTGGRAPIGVTDLDTGKNYASIKECARAINGTPQGIRYALTHCKPYRKHNLVLCEDYHD